MTRIPADGSGQPRPGHLNSGPTATHASAADTRLPRLAAVAATRPQTLT
jgi:hypothetical protein